jgi:hypothetical protein
MANKLITRLQQVARDMGWKDGALYIIARIIRGISGGHAELRKYYFVSQPIPDKPLLPSKRGASIVVAQVDSRHPLVSRFPRPAQIVAQRLARGALCFLATKDDHFVGFLWLQRGGYLEDEVRCLFTPLPANQVAWDFDVYVEPEYRSGFVFARLWDTANSFLREAKVKWSVSRVSAFNPGSINSHLRLGAFPIGSACFLSLGRFQLSLSSVPPFIHFSGGDACIPEIALPADPSRSKRYARFPTRPARPTGS